MAKNKGKQKTQEGTPSGDTSVERKRTFDTGPTDSTGMVPKSAKKD